MAEDWGDIRSLLSERFYYKVLKHFAQQPHDVLSSEQRHYISEVVSSWPSTHRSLYIDRECVLQPRLHWLYACAHRLEFEYDGFDWPDGGLHDFFTNLVQLPNKQAIYELIIWAESEDTQVIRDINYSTLFKESSHLERVELHCKHDDTTDGAYAPYLLHGILHNLPNPCKLKQLILRGINLHGNGLMILLNHLATHAPLLEKLHLFTCNLSDSDAKALSEWKMGAQLQEMWLFPFGFAMNHVSWHLEVEEGDYGDLQNRFTSRGARYLTQSPFLQDTIKEPWTTLT